MAETKIGGGGEWTALREALECAEYALTHRESNQLFALTAVREALAAAAPAPPAALNESDVLNALVDMTDGVMWKQPEEDGHVTRFTALLNKKFVAHQPDGQGAELLGPPPITPVNTGLALTHSAFKELYLQENLLGPPRGGSSSDLADSANLNVGRAPKIGWMDSIDFDHELGFVKTSEIHCDEAACRQEHTCITPPENPGHYCYPKRVYVFDADAYDATKPNPTPTTGPSEAVAGNASAPVGEKRQPSGVGEPRGIPKIPDAPDTRHASAEFERGVMSRLDWTDALHATYFALFKKQAPESMKPCEISHAIVDFTLPVAPREMGEGLREALELMVKELTLYAGQEGLGPARLQYALSRGVAALAAPAPKPAPPAEQIEILEAAESLLAHGDDLPSADNSIPHERLAKACAAVRRAAERKPPR